MPFDIALPKSSEERGEKGVGRNYPSIACSVCLVSKPDSGLVFQDLKKASFP